MTPTVAEPVRDDEQWDAHELVPCPRCDGRKTVDVDRADGTTVRRGCGGCSRIGQVLRGNPPDSPYEITHDFCARLYQCCKETAS